jgi:hypothetical protein
MLVRGSHLYAITVDELDLPRVVRYRIDTE